MIREIATAYGTMFVPDTDYAQFPFLSVSGQSIEHVFIEEVRRLLGERAPGVVIDGGMSYGCWSLAMAGFATEIVAYEVQPRIADLAGLSLLSNAVKNVTVRRQALGAASGEIRIALPGLDALGNFGGFSVLEPMGGEIEAVPMVALDDDPPAGRVSFIKLDIEGSEGPALAGAERLIRRDRPILFVEIEHPLTDKTRVLGALQGLGYALSQRLGNVLGVPV